MRGKTLIVALAVLLAAVVSAQEILTKSETITFADASIGFTASTLTLGDGRQVTKCVGRLETAQIRVLLTGGTPSTTVGMPVEIGDIVTIEGHANIAQFRGIRTGGTSGVIQFQCGAR